jgi:hypothetical protein
MNQVPVSTRDPNASAMSSSRVHTDAVSPKSLSFMRATASSSSRTRAMPTTGPKLSSLITRISCVASISTWGAR